MSLRSFSKYARPTLALFACALLTASGEGQEAGAGSRVVVQNGGLPGMDRGLRERDLPLQPAGRGTRGVVLAQRADGETPSRRYLAGSVIVKFKTGTGVNSVRDAMNEVDGFEIKRPSYADFEIMNIPATADAEVVAAELRARDDVAYAQPRYINHPMLRPNDEFYNRQWNFPLIDMERAWDIQPQAGSEITVAVLDSGVAFQTTTLRYTSRFPFRLTPGGPLYQPLGEILIPFAAAPDLNAPGKFVSPRDFIWDDNLPLDLDGHGTHVTGTIGQLTNNNGLGVAGMAFNVKIMPVKVIEENWDFILGSPFSGTDDVVARGIRYAADNGAKVINMSIGREEGGPATAVEEAMRYAVTRGVFIAVAGGNTADIGNAPNRTAEPASGIPGVMAVGAVGLSTNRAYYSTTNTYIEIAAPGGDQLRDGGTGGILQQTLDLDRLLTFDQGPAAFRPPSADAFAYYYFQGTSMATPHVAALAAMLMQQGITTPAAVEAAIKQFARDLGRPGVDSEFGWGLIQPRATLRGLGLAR
jgi:serine protease